MLYKVMARVEAITPPQNGEVQFQWVCVHMDQARGTAEALALRAAERGFRMDGDQVSTFYPQHRIALVEVMPMDLEVT